MLSFAFLFVMVVYSKGHFHLKLEFITNDNEWLSYNYRMS